MTIIGKGHPFLIKIGLSGSDGLAIMSSERIGKLPVDKVVIGSSYDIGFPGSEKTLERVIA